LLIDHGAKVNAQQHGGWAPLHAAAQHGDIETARALVAAGADVGLRADNQQRPLDLAVLKAQQAMVDFLEANGAKL
jgi:ankyrin repeat protein